MTPNRLKITVGSIVILAALSYLAVAGVKKGWVYLLPVDQFVTDSEYHARRVRLNGKVAADNLVISRSGTVADFTIKGETSTLRVSYKGVIPDMFKADHEVVVEGQLGTDQVFHADILMTKCASKYEATDGSKPPTNHPPLAKSPDTPEKQ
jgi:cytochrome c-type biogenesis protein CcmE